MITLAIETSVRPGSIALLRNDVCLGQVDLEQPGRRHGQTLHTSAKQLLDQHRLQPRDCDAISVSVGPGSFTGLRVGIVFAKTFAYVTGCRLAAVDSLLAVAEFAEAAIDRLVVVSDAQRKELFVGEYQRDTQGEWARIGEIQLASQAAWIDSLSNESVAGSCIEQLRDQLPATATIAALRSHSPTAESVGQIGQRMIADGRTADMWKLVPLYFRRSAAEENWERRLAAR
ncbi:MAG: tRNA (adenosine(37)-N6)-threonylcarbamoyltransferase complex dimerization subunit type 1 TsaB [Planctomycetota bacterium]|nr:tRNA (adenosine(37)-N6)-threonylcarbamoyltransferase complex dimerization subunit type 1 TsaB [Planctomycetota bacterium]